MKLYGVLVQPDTAILTVVGDIPLSSNYYVKCLTEVSNMMYVDFSNIFKLSQLYQYIPIGKFYKNYTSLTESPAASITLFSMLCSKMVSFPQLKFQSHFNLVICLPHMIFKEENSFLLVKME